MCILYCEDASVAFSAVRVSISFDFLSSSKARDDILSDFARFSLSKFLMVRIHPISLSSSDLNFSKSTDWKMDAAWLPKDGVPYILGFFNELVD